MSAKLDRLFLRLREFSASAPKLANGGNIAENAAHAVAANAGSRDRRCHVQMMRITEKIAPVR